MIPTVNGAYSTVMGHGSFIYEEKDSDMLLIYNKCDPALEQFLKSLLKRNIVLPALLKHILLSTILFSILGNQTRMRSGCPF